MVQEVYVSYETAKLLKEKGFDGKCARVWVEKKGNEPIRMGMSSFVEGEEVADNETVEAATGYANEYIFKNPCVAYLCPTLQMAMKWLREVHNRHITIMTSCELDYPTFIIRIEHYTKPLFFTDIQSTELYSSYEEACEAGIKYCLENLI